MKILSFSSKSGVTLVELMIALIIIALIILGGGMFFFYGRVNIIREANRRAALWVASQKLEELKAEEWENIVAYAGETIIDPLSDEYDLPNATMETEAQWVDDPSDGTVEEGDDEGEDYLKITVIVNWHDSTANSVSSTTLIARH